MTTSNVTPMAEHVNGKASTIPVGEWLGNELATKMQPRYHGITAQGDRIAVPLLRPDQVASVQIELTIAYGGMWVAQCAEPFVWQCVTDLDADAFNVIADAYGLEDERDDKMLVSPGRRHINHASLQWFDTFARGIESIIWCATAAGQAPLDYFDGVLYQTAEHLYRLECSFTKAFTARRFHQLSAEQQELYRDAAKSLLCGRIGHLNGKARRHVLAMSLVDVLPASCDAFTADSARCVGSAILDRFDDERTLVIDEALEHPSLTPQPTHTEQH